MASTTSQRSPKRSPAASAGERLSVSEREAKGKSLRSEFPRSQQAHYEPAAKRPDPVDVLEAQAATRVPDLVPVRYGRMLASPFTFYRGAAKIMAGDLASTPATGLRVQCCGDAHLSNFGVFGSPERRLLFDINDFDETLPGPWEWDVKRLAASILIAARENGFGAGDQDQIVLGTVGAYRGAMREFASMGNLAVWYARLDVEDVLNEYGSQFKPRMVKRTQKSLSKARARDSMSALSKLTERVDGRIEIVDQSPLIVPIRKLAGSEGRDISAQLKELLKDYAQTLEHDRRALIDQFELVDFARKVVGVGSVGTRAWIALLFGRDTDDPLFLQAKEAEASVLEEFAGKSKFANQGERVVAGQRLMQAASDIFLGWVHVSMGMDGRARDFYLRQLRDWKGSAEIEQMVPTGMTVYGRLCGWTLARAHARSGDRIAIASYLGGGTTFDRAILDFSKAYADQNEQDYQRLVEAVDSGQVQAQVGV